MESEKYVLDIYIVDKDSKTLIKSQGLYNNLLFHREINKYSLFWILQSRNNHFRNRNKISNC